MERRTGQRRVGLTHELTELIYLIKLYWEDLIEGDKKMILEHFEVVDTNGRLEVQLR